MNIKKEISTMYVYKWSQDLMYKSNVSKKKEKKRYILSSLHLSNKHMREVINHSTHIHLSNTIKSILRQTLEKLCKKRVYGK